MTREPGAARPTRPTATSPHAALAPGDPDKPGFGESLIPIWGSAREMRYAAGNGRPFAAVGYGALAVTDVFAVKALVTVGVKLALSGGLKVASEAAAHNAAQNVSAETVTHLTTQQAADGIATTQKLGSQWGVFAVDSSRVPTSAAGRNVVTLVPRQLNADVAISSDASRVFARPPMFGPLSGARRLAGVRSSPLGSIDLRSGAFVPGEIYRDGAFRMASEGEHARMLAHQWLLDYGMDSLLYTGAKEAMYQP
jgi:hypothetical protein